ncbi:MAG: serine hydrolase domain-containing protein [Gemmatimonadaceae bacterium]
MSCSGFTSHTTIVLTAVGLAVTATTLPAQTPSAAAVEAFADSAAALALQKGPIPSLSISVVRGPQTLLKKAYGYADLENDVLATPVTEYRIGSDTKQFTAAAIMRLVEQGKLHLDDDVRPFFPNFPFGSRHVTVRQLLTHTSGIANYTVHLDRFQREHLSHDSLLAKVNDKPFDFEPGSASRYSNTGYYMLGVIIEKVSGRSYKDYVQQEFFTPLGLTQTLYCSVEPLVEHRAQGYDTKDGKFVNADYIDMDLPFAAGSLCSTPSDLVKWSQALREGRVVSAASYRQMATPGVLNGGKPFTPAYGFGLGIADLEGHRSVSHGGGINGFTASLSTYPSDSLYVVVLSNVSGPGARQMAMFSQGLSRFVLGLPPAPPLPAPPAVPSKPATPAQRKQ